MSSSKTKKRDRPPIVVEASYVAAVHTCLAFTAFIGALFLACSLHFKNVVKNDVARWPDEWFPSVSASIGDWYPERNMFQIVIALTSGPRITLVCLQYYLTRSETSTLPAIVFLSGIVRTLSCGGWVYITSNDDHDLHDVLMILYIVSNVPWMLGGISCAPSASVKRNVTATAFFTSIIPMIYFFFQHKVNRIPGAYTRYAFFEWALIFFDILYDSVAGLDFSDAKLQIALGQSLVLGAIGPTPITAEATCSPGAIAPNHVLAPQKDIATSNKMERSSPVIGWHVSAEWRPPISFLSDIYLSYLFWSIFTSLAPTLFYFSVWELGIAGHELALLSTLSPILFSITPFLRWAITREGMMTLHVFSLAGIAAYTLDKPIHRLAVVTVATACSVLSQVAKWTGKDVGYQSVVTGLGLVVSSLSKHANHGNNPSRFWPFLTEKSGGYNKTGLALALLTLFEFFVRPASDQQPTQLKNVESYGKGNKIWLRPAITLGSLFFTLHYLLSDSSTMIAWSWTGYTGGRPNGPVPILHGSLTLIAQCFGLLLPLTFASSVQHPAWFAYGATSAYVMYSYKDWVGYAGGLNFAIFVMSIIPVVLVQAQSTECIGKTYFVALGVTCVFDLACVWTVAYAFVPGGVYLRERTDLVLFAQMAGLGLAFDWTRLKPKSTSLNLPGSTSTYARTGLALVSILSVLVTLYRLPASPPKPFKPAARILTAGIWTLHFGIDNKGRDSQRGVRDLIQDMQLDVVGLLESDLHRVVFGNRDLTRVLAEESYNIDIGPGPNSHTWGAALLSKFPIINSTHHLLPSPHGELAPAIEAVLDVYGIEVTVVVAHNGQEEDSLDRELQSTELARIMAKSYPQPVIFLGYVVTEPKAKRPAPYELLVTDGQMHDIDHDDWDRWCEYILYRGLYRTAYARLSRGEITDTELQVGQFVVPRQGFTNETDSDEARYLRSWKEALPQDHWMSMEYYGDEKGGGVNGHHYHVFNTPLYYKIPEGAVL